MPPSSRPITQFRPELSGPSTAQEMTRTRRQNGRSADSGGLRRPSLDSLSSPSVAGVASPVKPERHRESGEWAGDS